MKIKTVLFVTGLLFSGITNQLLAQPSIQMRVEANPREVTIGDPIQYRMTVIYSTDLAPAPISLPEPIGEFQMMDYQVSEPKKNNRGKWEQNHQLLLTTFSTGTQTIPGLSLVFATQEGKQAQAKTQNIDIQVISLLEKHGDEGSLRPLKGFFNFRSYRWIWLLLGTLAVLALIIWGLKYRKQRQKNKPEKEKPKRPPEEIIWEAIQHLEDSDLMSEGKSKEFYSSLTSALRVYFEGRFQISALDKTSSELLMEFRNLNLSGEQMNLIRSLFSDADLVKFAKFTPPQDQLEDSLEKVKKLVALSTPPKVEKEKKEKIPV